MISVVNAATTAEIDRIASLEEPVLRNLRITQCYYELSLAFTYRMGPVANWCTFAVWASRQAGQTIRRQDLRQTLEASLLLEPEIEAAFSLVVGLAKQIGAQQTIDQLRESAIGSLLTTAAARASDAVSRGNKKVFEEIAREFSRFIADCTGNTFYNPSHIEAFCLQLKPGPPSEGQDHLRRAFEYYYFALFEKDPKQKAELNLLANLLIGFHEQSRLQPEIAEAMNASLFDERQLKTFISGKLRSGISFQSKFIFFFKRLAGKTGLLDRAIELLVQRLQFHLRRVLTAHLMTLTIPPGKHLRLGKDLAMVYPEDLQKLINADLLAMLSGIDPTPGSLLESGSDDWADLHERMHFISELFRCCHTAKEMFDPPFSDEQVELIRQGQLPAGNL